MVKWRHIEEVLHNKYVWEIKIKYNRNHRKHRYEPIQEPKKKFNRTFIDEKLAVKVIMGCKT